MTTVSAPRRRHESLDTAEATSASGAAQPASAKRRAHAEAPLCGTAQGLVSARGTNPAAAFARASGSAARSEAARAAIAPLAAAVGEDAATFAQRYSGARYQHLSPSAVRSQATLEFTRDVLARRPDQADALIDVRLRGASSDARELVHAAVAESGSQGLRRYSAAETALATLRPFSREERGDLVGMVRAGSTFSGAVAQENKELHRVAAEQGASLHAATPRDVRQAALEGLASERAGVTRLSAEMNAVMRQVGTPSPALERFTGVVGATHLVGSRALLHPIETIELAGDLGERMVEAPLSAASQRARDEHHAFVRLAGEYGSVADRLERCISEARVDEIAPLRGRLGTLRADLDAQAERVRARASQAGAATTQLDRHIVETAVDLAHWALRRAVPENPVERAIEHRISPLVGERAAKRASELIVEEATHRGKHAVTDAVVGTEH